MSTLKKLREEFEEGLVLEHEEHTDGHTLMVILSHPFEQEEIDRFVSKKGKHNLIPKYTLIKYFHYGNNDDWQCSVEAQEKSIANLFKVVFKIIKKLSLA